MENNLISEREKIANRVKEARSMSGLSQAQAAAKLNIPRPSISEIESGKRKVTAEEIIQFASLYKVDKSWLLLEDEDKDLKMNQHVLFAARELNKLKSEDRDKVIEIIKMLPKK
jgi:transcriptional regulator with XRE-family HTH domain